jgi:pyruvate/2-oxoglutarate dehydrogenase complex dihydrolipoamide acyltransferase (E2) component
MPPTSERLDFAERWLLDGLRVLRPPFSVLQTSVDMTEALRYLEHLRQEGVRATSTHLLVSAAARVLASGPRFHQIVAGSRRHRPERVDIGLSVSGEAFVAPVLVIEGADRKSVREIASEVERGAPQALAADRRMRDTLRRWGWLVPLGFLRRTLLRLLFSSPRFRRKGAGTFQVSTVAGDWGISSVFATSGVLVGGQISSRVVVVDGQPAVRPVMTLSLSADHGVWDGRSAALFLAGVKAQLEKDWQTG